MRYFKLLEVECHKVDIDRVGERDQEELHEQWQQFSEETQDAKVEADNATQRSKMKRSF